MSSLIRNGMAYEDVVTVPVRILALIEDENAKRMLRLGRSAKKNKAWGMVNLGDLQP